MRYSIFILLFFVYALVGVISFYVVRMMRREGSSQVAATSSGPGTKA